jgi:hypothetical protein
MSYVSGVVVYEAGCSGRNRGRSSTGNRQTARTAAEWDINKERILGRDGVSQRQACRGVLMMESESPK